MARTASSEADKEYAELRAYLDYYASHIWSIDPTNPAHPSNVGASIVAKFGKARALAGLREAVNDTVQDMSFRPPQHQAQLDDALRALGLLTFSEVRRRYSSAYKRILKRGSIKTDTEYYLVVGILSDTALLPDDHERQILNDIVTGYEARDT